MNAPKGAATKDVSGGGVRRNKAQTEILQTVAAHGEAWFRSNGTTYGLRPLEAAHALADEGLVRIDHESGTTTYRVLPALSEQQS